jgi:hypothetical protein
VEADYGVDPPSMEVDFNFSGLAKQGRDEKRNGECKVRLKKPHGCKIYTSYVADNMLAVVTSLSYFTLSAFIGITALLADQRYRPALFILLFISAVFSFLHVGDITTDVSQGSVLGLFVLIWLSHMSNVLLLENHVILSASKLGRWLAAYKMMFNARWLGTTKQAPNVRSREVRSDFPAKKHDTKNTPLSYLYLTKRSLSATTIYILNHLYHRHILTPHPALYTPLQLSDFSPPQQTYLRRVPSLTITARETLLRSLLVIHFIWHAWATLNFLHNFLAFIFVSLRLDDPNDWPPLYGPLSQTYTLRRFWGKFWHRLVCRTYTNYGKLLSRGILGLKPRGVVDRLVAHGVVFCASGLVHALVSWQLEHCAWWGDVYWFCLNFIAMAGEGLVLSVGRGVLGPRFADHKGWRVLGYLWVFAFMFWSLPKMQYPKVYCMAVES